MILKKLFPKGCGQIQPWLFVHKGLASYYTATPSPISLAHTGSLLPYQVYRIWGLVAVLLTARAWQKLSNESRPGRKRCLSWSVSSEVVDGSLSLHPNVGRKQYCFKFWGFGFHSQVLGLGLCREPRFAPGKLSPCWVASLVLSIASEGRSFLCMIFDGFFEVVAICNDENVISDIPV